MANICRKCGTKLAPDAKFCPECGLKIRTSSRSAAPEQRPARRQTRERRKGSPLNSLLSVILTVVMVAELLVIAYVRPGYLRKDPVHTGVPSVQTVSGGSSSGGSIGGSSGSNTSDSGSSSGGSGSSNTGDSGSNTGGSSGSGSNTGLPAAQTASVGDLSDSSPGGDAEEDSALSEEELEALLEQLDYTADFPEALPAADEIVFRYTPEQIQSAPVQKAKVTRENPVADFGDVRVDLKSWNLDQEEDELILRELPEADSEEDGVTFKCWDFSLASGQDEFVTSVAITVPRTSGAAVDCVSFNEETGQWEDEYSELSEDGTQRTIYVTHFSVKGFYFDKKEFKLKAGNLTVNLDHGIFCETEAKNKKKGLMTYVNRMMLPVKVDEDRMWQMYQKKTLDDVGRLPGLINRISEGVDMAAAARQDYTEADSMNTWFGYGGLAANMTSLMSIAPVAGGILGGFCTLMDVSLTTIKVTAEAESGDKGFANAILDAVNNHKLDITNAAVGVATPVAAAISSTAGLCFTVAGIVLFAAASIYNGAVELQRLDASSKMSDPLHLFRGYYNTGLLRADFGSKRTNGRGRKEYAYLILRRLPSMDQDKFNALAAVLRKNGLQTKGEKGWAEAFKEIIRSYSGDAVYLNTVLDEIYFSFAYGFWDLPPEAVEAFIEDSGATADISKLTQEEKNKLSQDLAFDMRIRTRQVLQEAAKTVQQEQYKAVAGNIKKKLVPLLNTQLVFHVEDTSLAPGQTRKDSVYYYDWRFSKENNRILKNGGTRADYVVSMKFEGADEPLFFPVDSEGNEGNPKKYHPYGHEGSFLPVMKESSDVVFSCTLYHYLMMGCPKAMVFTNMKDPNAKQERKEIDLSAVDGTKKKVDIYLKVGGTKKEETYRLRVMTDWIDSGSDIHVSFGHPQPPEISTLRIHPDGSFDLEVAPVGKLEWEYSEDLQVSLSRQGFSCKGVFIESRTDVRRGILTGLGDVSSESTSTETNLLERFPESAVSLYKTRLKDPQLMEPGKEITQRWSALSDSYSNIQLRLNEKTGKPESVELTLTGTWCTAWTHDKKTEDREDKNSRHIEFAVAE